MFGGPEGIREQGLLDSAGSTQEGRGASEQLRGIIDRRVGVVLQPEDQTAPAAPPRPKQQGELTESEQSQQAQEQVEEGEEAES